MMTITYEYGDHLYVNLTNRCDCSCTFCLRNNGHSGSIYADDLWLDREPTREEALNDLLARDMKKYTQLVFCGFGEPTYRIDDILWLVKELRGGACPSRRCASTPTATAPSSTAATSPRSSRGWWTPSPSP